jgi:hypothetical protein
VSDAQVRKLMEEMSKHGRVGRAALMAGMDRKTGGKYVKEGKLPSEMGQPRQWRTRQDAFEEDWPEVEALLKETPELEAKTLLETLQERHPGRYHDGQLRTLQRRIRRWRAECGPDKEVMFGQAHRPGEAAQTDFTSATELGITIAGQLFVHLLCVVVLPFSNWRWVTVCLSESMTALKRGVQAALFQLGRVPEYHQTDNSTSATHRIGDEEGTKEKRKRRFNEEYLLLMRHFRMTPRTTEVGQKQQNGDVEAGNGVLKRQLEQALLMRGSRDFESREAWEQFAQGVVRKGNAARGPLVAQELAVMRPLDVSRLPEYTEEDVRVSEWSTIRVKGCAYSVPSRLIRERVRVRVYEERLEVYYKSTHQLTVERVRGRQQRHRIDYRHVIFSLVQKPGAFSRYVYREEMFPSVVFRRAYDAIQALNCGVKGDLEYLRILYLAASTLEVHVEAALVQLLGEGQGVTVDAVKRLSQPEGQEVPTLQKPVVDLGVYDELLEAAV